MKAKALSILKTIWKWIRCGCWLLGVFLIVPLSVVGLHAVVTSLLIPESSGAIQYEMARDSFTNWSTHWWTKAAKCLEIFSTIVWIDPNENKITPGNAGLLGDFVGGFIGTILFLISLIVLFVTFWNQRETNRRAAFESRFFELLRYHRDNTTEIDLGEVKGRRGFVYLFREWRLLHELVTKAAANKQISLNGNQISQLAYIALFNGSGPNGHVLLEDNALAKNFDPSLITEIINLMSQDWEVYQRCFPVSRLRFRKPSLLSSGKTKAEDLEPLPYVPFGGHHSRLAHYYRHLYHLVKFAALHAPRGKASEYVDLARAQLTTSEQALLALHAYSIPSGWDRGDYIQEYHFIKNIPPGFFKKENFDVRGIYPRVVFMSDGQVHRK